MIEEGSIPYSRISVPEQEEGDVLFFDGNANGGDGKWKSYPISGLNFVGDWNVKDNIPEIFGGGFYNNSSGEKTSAVSGDYFIVTQGGKTVFDGNNTVEWGPGDWLIFNGRFWDKISNNGTVARVFGRKGHIKAGFDRQGNAVFDYTWEQVVKEPYRINPRVDGNTSSIFQIENVEAPATIASVRDGSILKWDKASQSWMLKEDKVGITGKIESSHIVDGTILDEDVADDAEIEISKITGLQQPWMESLILLMEY